MKEVFTRTLYLSGKDNIELMKLAEEIMKREKWSFNKLVEKAMTEFVARHRFGNETFQLDKFGVEWNEAKKAPELCGWKGCRNLSVVQATHLITHRKYMLCKFHLRLIEGDREVWRIEK